MAEKKTYLDAFEDLHFTMASAGNGQGKTDCPWCGKPGKPGLFVAAETGLWQCKACGRKGNLVNFMTEYASHLAEETVRSDYERLSKERGNVPWRAFKDAGLGWDGEQWIIPVRSETGTCRDLRRWTPGGRVMSVSTCKLQLLWLDELVDAKAGLPVWVCEGEWDAIVWRWVLRELGRDDVVVGLPGAGTFKDEWLEHFKDRKVFKALKELKLRPRATSMAGRGTRTTAEQLLSMADHSKWPSRCSNVAGWQHLPPPSTRFSLNANSELKSTLANGS